MQARREHAPLHGTAQRETTAHFEGLYTCPDYGNRKIRGLGFFRSVFFYPVPLSPVVVALI